MTKNICKTNCTCGRHNRKKHVVVRGEKCYLCPKCNEWKPEKDWFTRSGSGLLRPWCKSCHSIYERERRLAKKFSLTIEDYNRILEFQNGVCAICEKPPKTINLAVDHDHKTGLVRGLVCWACNSAIGKFNDDPYKINKAYNYLINPPATQALKEERFGVIGSVTNRRRKRKKNDEIRPRSRRKVRKDS